MAFGALEVLDGLSSARCAGIDARRRALGGVPGTYTLPPCVRSIGSRSLFSGSLRGRLDLVSIEVIELGSGLEFRPIIGSQERLLGIGRRAIRTWMIGVVGSSMWDDEAQR